MNKKLLLSLVCCFCFSLGYSQPASLGVTLLDTPPLQGGTAANVGIAIIGGTPFSTYTVTLTCTDCTPVTKDLNTNNAGFVIDTDFFVDLPEINGNLIFEAVFIGPDCLPCNQQSLPAAVMPVELVSFEGAEKEQGVYLSWATAAEINNSHFDILYSQDGKVFESIGQVEGAGTTNEWNDYEFLHRVPGAGDNYYQLKQTDFDGQFSSSEIIVIQMEDIPETKINIFPNPTINWLELNTNSPMSGVQLLDSNGRTVYLMQQDLGYHHQFDLSPQLPNGIYLIKVELENGEQKLEKVLLQR